ncbi:hypothetical protein EYC80_006212 [Monilinia laxa]|uniref:Uncharacterized protein n=1 Tax=Monilinia laxa TaxID=61186 RepID=A0A5N6KGV9_MONLA|nr:hypothetical protein EYC80_006212 [Monilinia laxa]
MSGLLWMVHFLAIEGEGMCGIFFLSLFEGRWQEIKSLRYNRIGMLLLCVIPYRIYEFPWLKLSCINHPGSTRVSLRGFGKNLMGDLWVDWGGADG